MKKIKNRNTWSAGLLLAAIGAVLIFAGVFAGKNLVLGMPGALTLIGFGSVLAFAGMIRNVRATAQ